MTHSPIGKLRSLKTSKWRTSVYDELHEDDHPPPHPMKGTKVAAVRATTTIMVAQRAASTPVAEGTITADPSPEKMGMDPTTTEAITATVAKVRTKRQDGVPSMSKMGLQST